VGVGWRESVFAGFQQVFEGSRSYGVRARDQADNISSMSAATSYFFFFFFSCPFCALLLCTEEVKVICGVFDDVCAVEAFCEPALTPVSAGCTGVGTCFGPVLTTMSTAVPSSTVVSAAGPVR
jgi:hypothetical protein